MKQKLLFAASVIALFGCDRFEGKTISFSGAGVVLDEPLKPYDEPKLTELILQSVPSTWRVPAPSPSPPNTRPSLEQVLGWFSTLQYTAPAPQEQVQNALRDARNQVQGAVMTRSGNLCNAFKLALRERTSWTNFGLGTAAVALGAAGAVVTGTASQALSATAAAATGTQSEYNRDILSSVTTSVIIPGIEKQRTALLQEISNRRCYGIRSYSLTQALVDAVRFHSACSTDVGVAAAGSALSQSRSTSLADARATLDAINSLRATLPAPAPARAGPAGTSNTGRAGGSTSVATGQSSSSITTGSDTGRPTGAGKDTVLLGDPIDIGECTPLDQNGLITEVTTGGAGRPSSEISMSARAGASGTPHTVSPVTAGQRHSDR